MSTPVAGALAVTPLYGTAADAIVLWDDGGATWRSLGTIPVGGGTVTSISGGPGITVSPSPIVGAGTVSLTVPVAVASGGTGTATAMTAGSVLFAGAAGVFSQDNANLFWDDGNNRLGIGTATPGVRLDVAGGVLFNDISANIHGWGAPAAIVLGTGAKAVASTNGLYIVSDDASANQMFAVFGMVGDPTGANRRAKLECLESGVAYRNVTLCENAGNVGIGTASPDVRLAVWQTLSGTPGAGAINIGQAGDRSYWSFRVAGAADFAIDAYWTSWATALTILRSNNNVGIGTTSPSVKVDVAGAINATGDVVSTGGSLRFAVGGGLYASSNIVLSTAVFDAGYTIWYDNTNAGSILLGRSSDQTNYHLAGYSLVSVADADQLDAD